MQSAKKQVLSTTKQNTMCHRLQSSVNTRAYQYRVKACHHRWWWSTESNANTIRGRS